MNPNEKYDDDLARNHEKTMLEAKSIHPKNVVGRDDEQVNEQKMDYPKRLEGTSKPNVSIQQGQEEESKERKRKKARRKGRQNAEREEERSREFDCELGYSNH